MGKKEPYIVMNCTRTMKRLANASSFTTLLTNACSVLELRVDPVTVRVFMDHAGAEVTRQSWTFSRFRRFAMFVILRPGEEWLPTPPMHLNAQLQRGVDRSHLESIEEDDEWFVGLADKFTLKNQFLSWNSTSRIRGYLRNLRQAINKQVRDPFIRKRVFGPLLHKFKVKLRENGYHGCYFDRLSLRAICNEEGVFPCEGKYYLAMCDEDHPVKPAANRHSRKLFEKFEYDHQVPQCVLQDAFIQASQNVPRGMVLNWEYFYSMFFTRANVRLVNGIFCHEKGARPTIKLDEKSFFTDRKLEVFPESQPSPSMVLELSEEIIRVARAALPSLAEEKGQKERESLLKFNAETIYEAEINAPKLYFFGFR
ncbi:putative DNA fragmentation factor subunit beta [Hypsibius exemplaris]|uniref:DNAation factor subunit beta n=1 Tax=Hypsibius exemplaris TaxID=2072580 RepID=A0A9X6RM91_HYPEX|nr:putative DNA fragmentation factor subunit beta [Hypsibius exemplaris]